MAELLTIARYRELWSDQRCVICVFHNGDLNQVTWELRAMGGSPKFEPSQSLPEVSYADFAIEIGLGGITVDDPARLGEAWDVALSADVPTVLKGDPHAWHLVTQGLKTKMQELLPSRG